MSIRSQLPTPHPFFPRVSALLAIVLWCANCGGSTADEPIEDQHDHGVNHDENHDAHDMSESDDTCGEHGEWHEDHCHCDEGYVASKDGRACLEEDPDVVADMGGEQDMPGDPDMGHEEDMGQDLGGQDQGMEEPPSFAFEPTVQRGAVDTAEDGSHIWLLEAEDGDTILRLELYEAYGAPSQPGTVMLEAIETNYATCGTCVIVQTGCAAHGDHFHCQRTFMPEAQGSVSIESLGTSAGSTLSGSLDDVMFREVTIAQDYETTPVVDGQRKHLSTWAFEATLEDLGGGEEPECGGHGHLHGDSCHCDAGYKIDPMDSTNCIPG